MTRDPKIPRVEYYRNRIDELERQRTAAQVRQAMLLPQAFQNPQDYGQGQMIEKIGPGADAVRARLEETTKALQKTEDKLNQHRDILSKLEALELERKSQEDQRERDDERER